MALTSKKTESAYAGFLNGYIAGNLAANTPELHLHADRICKFLLELKSDVFKWELSEERREKLSTLFSSKHISAVSAFTQTIDYLSLGNSIYDLLDYILNIKADLPSSTSFIFKKVVYHYLHIAKTTKDLSIVNEAKRIAQKFEASAS